MTTTAPETQLIDNYGLAYRVYADAKGVSDETAELAIMDALDSVPAATAVSMDALSKINAMYSIDTNSLQSSSNAPDVFDKLCKSFDNCPEAVRNAMREIWNEYVTSMPCGYGLEGTRESAKYVLISMAMEKDAKRAKFAANYREIVKNSVLRSRVKAAEMPSTRLIRAYHAFL